MTDHDQNSQYIATAIGIHNCISTRYYVVYVAMINFSASYAQVASYHNKIIYYAHMLKRIF